MTQYIMGVSDPHCAFDFLYDTEWFIVVTSPIMLAVMLLVGLALRLLLALLCNLWLPPIHRHDLYIPNPFRNAAQPYVLVNAPSAKQMDLGRQSHADVQRTIGTEGNYMERFQLVEKSTTRSECLWN